MSVLDGSFAELLAAVGAVAAGGAFVGTAFALGLGAVTRARSIGAEEIAKGAAWMSLAGVALAALEAVVQ